MTHENRTRLRTRTAGRPPRRGDAPSLPDPLTGPETALDGARTGAGTPAPDPYGARTGTGPARVTAPRAGARTAPDGRARTEMDAPAPETAPAGARTETGPATAKAPGAGRAPGSRARAATAPRAGAAPRARTVPDPRLRTAPDTHPAPAATAALPSHRATRATGPSARHRDRGQVAIEYLGFLPVLLLVGLAGLQLGFAAYAAQQAGTAARAAARAEAVRAEDPLGPDPDAVGWAAAPWATAVDAGQEGDVAVATVTVRVPSVVPFLWEFDPVKKTATMPLSDEEARP